MREIKFSSNRLIFLLAIFCFGYSKPLLALYHLLDTYKIEDNFHYKNRPHSLTSTDGFILSENPFLLNIYSYAEKKSSIRELVHSLFHSVDNVNLPPSKSNSSLAPQLNSRAIGTLLYLTRYFENDLQGLKEIKEESLKNHYQNFLIEKMTMFIRCDRSFDKVKRGELVRSDLNPEICKDPSKKVVPQIEPFLKSMENIITAPYCFETLERKKLRQFFKIYIDALMENWSSEHSEWDQWKNISNLPEKVLLALFVKKAQNSNIAEETELNELYGGQFRAPSHLKLTRFGKEEFQILEKKPSGSQTQPNEAYFMEIYQKGLRTDIPQIGNFLDVDFALKAENDNESDKIIVFGDCGEMSLLNFFNTIFRDSAQQKVTPQIYQERIQWHPRLIQYYEKERSYHNIPTKVDHEDFAKVVSSLPGVDYAKPEPPQIPICELNAGVDNIISVFENLMKMPPDYAQAKTRSEKIDLIFKFLNRPELKLDWKIMTEHEKIKLDEKNTDVDLVISINGSDTLQWHFGDGHFFLTALPGNFSKTYLPDELASESPYFPHVQGRTKSVQAKQHWILKNLKDHEGQKAVLLSALSSEHLPSSFLIDFLLSLPVDDTLNNLLCWAYLQKFSNEIDPQKQKRLQAQSKNYTPNNNDYWIFEWAIKNQHAALVNLMLQARDQAGKFQIDPAENNNSAIRIAAVVGNVDVVKMLLAAKDDLGIARINPQAKNSIALKEAKDKGHGDVVKLLLEAQ